MPSPKNRRYSSPYMSHAEKKYLPCLNCGKKWFTDSAHRICKKCQRRNENVVGEKFHHVGHCN